MEPREPGFYGMTVDELPPLDEILPHLTLEGLVLYVHRATNQPRPTDEQVQSIISSPPFVTKNTPDNTGTPTP